MQYIVQKNVSGLLIIIKTNLNKKTNLNNLKFAFNVAIHLFQKFRGKKPVVMNVAMRIKTQKNLKNKI